MFWKLKCTYMSKHIRPVMVISSYFIFTWNTTDILLTVIWLNVYSRRLRHIVFDQKQRIGKKTFAISLSLLLETMYVLSPHILIYLITTFGNILMFRARIYFSMILPLSTLSLTLPLILTLPHILTLPLTVLCAKHEDVTQSLAVNKK